MPSSSMAQSPAAKPLAKQEPARQQQPVNKVVVEESVAVAADGEPFSTSSQSSSTRIR